MPFALILLSAFLVLLPWNGAISVLTVPDSISPFFKFWKEIILLIAIIGGIIKLAKKETLQEFFFIPSHLWGLVFSVWIGIVFLLGPSDQFALMAARSLLIGILTFWAFKIWNFSKNQKQLLARAFTASLVFSIFFGIYISWLELPAPSFLAYSDLISSWVPGQAIPIYHESVGIPRIQGGSSGPIEFSHLILFALFWALFYESKSPFMVLIIGILFFGIMGSLSRSAIIGGILLALFFYFYKNPSQKSLKEYKKTIGILILFCVIVLLGLYIFFPEQLLRDGTVRHFLYPIEGVQKAFENFWLGDLGSIGGAARSENLATIDSDQAFISENVWIDLWLHAGIIGLILYIMFFKTLFLESPKIKPLLIVMAVLMMMASLWDMVPISIGFFAFIALSSQFNTSDA